MSEREEPQGSFSIFYAEGEVFSKQGLYVKAVDSFTKALDFQHDEGCFVARSHCYLQLGNTAAALKDAEDSLVENKKYHKGLYQKAEVLYAMGSFEHALMFYHRGNNIRPQMHEFRLGIQKAQEAINNSIGSSAACRLENIGDLTFFREQDAVGKKRPKKLMKPSTYMQLKKEGMRKERKAVVASEKSVKELLGELYHDREYLDKLMKDPSLLIKNKDYSIYNKVEDALIFLDERTEFWRQQKPMYARKREKELKKFKPPPTKPITVRTESMQRTKDILKSLQVIDEALTNGEVEVSLKLAKKLLSTTKKLTDREVHNKQELLAHIHSCIGNAQLELGEAEFALQHHLKDLEIAEQLGIPENLSRALDSVARVHAWMGEYQDAITYYGRKLPLVSSSEESAWLHHELARCHLEMGRYPEALKLGEKAFGAAVDAADNIWQLNANMLLSQIKKRMGDVDGAKEFFKRTMELAMMLNDEGTLTVVKSALEELENKFEGASEEKEDGEGGEEKEKSESEEGGEEKGDEYKDNVQKAGGEYEKEEGQGEVEGSVERTEETEGEQEEVEETEGGEGMLQETEEFQEEFEENEETEEDQDEFEGSEETDEGKGKVDSSVERSEETEGEQGKGEMSEEVGEESEGGQGEVVEGVEGSEDAGERGKVKETEGNEVEGSEKIVGGQGEEEGRVEGSEQTEEEHGEVEETKGGEGEVEGSEKTVGEGDTEGSKGTGGPGKMEGSEDGSKEIVGEKGQVEEMEGGQGGGQEEVERTKETRGKSENAERDNI